MLERIWKCGATDDIKLMLMLNSNIIPDEMRKRHGVGPSSVGVVSAVPVSVNITHESVFRLGTGRVRGCAVTTANELKLF